MTAHQENRFVFPAMKIIAFKVKDDYFGIDIMRVVEVVNYRSLQKVPQPPPFVDGVLKFRDNIIPILDFRRRLESANIVHNPDTRIIIFKKNTHLIGIVVDEASEVVSYVPDEVLTSPDFIIHIKNEFIEGFLEKGNKSIILLDFDKILTTEESLLLDNFRQCVQES
ncbi:chemotaxis protein CheW [candidate division CSSED10-310 bacterium]|uniref:Chemotaxis protein CheW n=1 Tax=candidate division CSSED10-310 bacterium TaxID=2855610 RepID=A0ABV6YRY2_UNCC1